MSSNVHELITTVTNVFIAEMTDEARKAQFADVMVDESLYIFFCSVTVCFGDVKEHCSKFENGR